MKITVLVEDSSDGTLQCEHGLSLYIESEYANILFDTGQSDLFYKNAEKLGVDLSAVDFAVISHGHYDHGGGLKKFLEVNKTALVYVSRNAFGNFYNGEKYIGLDKSLKMNERFILIQDNIKIGDGAEIFVNKGLESGVSSFGLTAEENGIKKSDTFLHEIYLCLETDGKKVLFSGCSHSGIEGIMRRFKPDIFIGGFHLIKVEDEKLLQKLAKVLSGYNTEYYTCHCTGQRQYEYLKNHLKSLKYLSTGDTIIS